MKHVASGAGTSTLGDPRLGPVASRITLGNRLRMLREASGIARDVAGHAIRASGAKITRLELGQVRFKDRDVDDLLTLYGVTEVAERAGYVELAQEGRVPGWWQPYGSLIPSWFETYLGLELAASSIGSYDLQFVPGLLQTPDYARSVIALQHDDPAELDRRVELRLRRQQLLDRTDPPDLWFVIDETALRRPLAGPHLCRAQLTHLLEQIERPQLRVQIATLDRGGHVAAGGSFSLLRFGKPALPDTVYLEQLTSAIYPNKPVEVERYQSIMNTLCAQVEPAARTADILFAIRASLP